MVKLAQQARDPVPHYEHSEIGNKYHLSNVLGAIGRRQLSVLEERVQVRWRNFANCQAALGDLPGLAFMPEAPWGRSTRWLTVVTIDHAFLPPELGGSAAMTEADLARVVEVIRSLRG